MNLAAIPVRRPVATAMVYVALVLLGWIGWQRLPVELIPPLQGNTLHVNFVRPGSEPDIVEREILLPLAGRVAELPGLVETSGSVRAAGGRFTARFELDSDLKVRELELRRIASELARTQPPGTVIDVSTNDFALWSRFAMVITLTGIDDLNALRAFAQENIEHRLAAVPDVSQILFAGGSPPAVTVWIDPDRCAAYGIAPADVTAALQRAAGRLRHVGGIEDEAGRTTVLLDGRTRGLRTLEDTVVVPGGPVRLRHVATVEQAADRPRSISRVDGRRALTALVFQEQGANLVELGSALRKRIAELNQEYAEYGIKIIVSFDAAEMVEQQLDRVKRLGLSGFVIALVVLFLFLRQWRAVAVVAVAVPVSLLIALAFLFLNGQSLNLMTIFGLAVGIGMLVDNSIVVYEAVQRRLERGATPDGAAEGGVRRTVRAILAASLTTAVVFLPMLFLEFELAEFHEFLKITVLAILLPLAGSVIVALGLVPLLARWLAAPAALKRIAALVARREALAGLRPPERGREVFTKLLVVALRRPAGWVTSVTVAVLLTVVIALPWIGFNSTSREPTEADNVMTMLELPADASLETAEEIVALLEAAVGELEGIERIETALQDDGNGNITVYLVDKPDRPANVNAARVRERIRTAARDAGIEARNPGDDPGGAGGGSGADGGLAGLLGQGPAEIIVSGPETAMLDRLAGELRTQLSRVEEISAAWISGMPGQEEIHVIPDEQRLAGYGLTGDQVIPALSIVRREGVQMRVGYTKRDGEEIPLVVRRESEGTNAGVELQQLRLATPSGSLPIAAMADVRRMPPPPTIQHKNGRRELSVYYRFGNNAPQTGPARQALERQVRSTIGDFYRPAGYVVEQADTSETRAWFKQVLVPVVLLLFAVLAVTFESLTLPLLVLIALPLTVLGAVWALVLAGMPADPMALLGALALIGLTVNPAILLVDRMQQRVLSGATSPGAAALAAVRERTRPVLMTSATTIAGLWPLALVTGQENEAWPPFATVIMGGLATSTVLTLLVIPVGFVGLSRLDRLFGRLGPWIMIGWVAATSALMTPLILTGLISSMTWKIITSVLVATLLLGFVVLVLRRPERVEPQRHEGSPPRLEVRYLKKIYGKAGPVAHAWRLPETFARKVRALGGRPFTPLSAREKLPSVILLLAGALYLVQAVRSAFWHLTWVWISVVLGVTLLKLVRRARGRVDEQGRILPGGPESILAALLPWIAVAYVAGWRHLRAVLADDDPESTLLFVVATVLVVLVVQLGRRTAVRIARGDIAERLDRGRLRRARSMWRYLSRRVFGLDLPRQEVNALSHVHFTAERGMIGILGPNGAGKTTLLRQLAGILDPTVGNIVIGGVPLRKLRRTLARWVGYLPQDFGLPDNLTAREYLDYFALLYEIRPDRRRQRVDRLLAEVGLGARADERIGSYSGGMRQRVAVARTLLRLPSIIIVDEPTVGLDPRERIRFRNLLSRLSEGRIVLFSTHVVEDVAVACERVIVMANGRMVFDGAPLELSALAEGKVWRAMLLPEEREALPASVRIVDEIPEPGDMIRLRILADEKPHESAEPEPASLEDGYFVLTGAHA